MSDGLWASLSPKEFNQLEKYSKYSTKKLKDVLEAFYGTDQESKYNSQLLIDYEGFKVFMKNYLDGVIPEELCKHLFLSFTCKNRKGSFMKRSSRLSQDITSGPEDASILDRRTQHHSKNVSFSVQSPFSSLQAKGSKILKENEDPDVTKNSLGLLSPSPSDVMPQVIYLKDIICYLSLLERGRTQDKLEFMFRLYDTDGNGYLDSNELEQILNEMVHVAEYLKWDCTELKSILKNMMKEIDINHDGIVTLKEWIHGGMTTIPLLVLLGMETNVNEDGQHSWKLKNFKKPAFCHFCHVMLTGMRRQALCCSFCKYTVHSNCLSENIPPCISTYAKSRRQPEVMQHVWMEGSNTMNCDICSKTIKCYQPGTSIHCVWCQITIHQRCSALISEECDGGQLKDHILLPTSIFPMVLITKEEFMAMAIPADTITDSKPSTSTKEISGLEEKKEEGMSTIISADDITDSKPSTSTKDVSELEKSQEKIPDDALKNIGPSSSIKDAHELESLETLNNESSYEFADSGRENSISTDLQSSKGKKKKSFDSELTSDFDVRSHENSINMDMLYSEGKEKKSFDSELTSDFDVRSHENSITMDMLKLKNSETLNNELTDKFAGAPGCESSISTDLQKSKKKSFLSELEKLNLPETHDDNSITMNIQKLKEKKAFDNELINLFVDVPSLVKVIKMDIQKLQEKEDYDNELFNLLANVPGLADAVRLELEREASLKEQSHKSLESSISTDLQKSKRKKSSIVSASTRDSLAALSSDFSPSDLRTESSTTDEEEYEEEEMTEEEFSRRPSNFVHLRRSVKKSLVKEEVNDNHKCFISKVSLSETKAFHPSLMDGHGLQIIPPKDTHPLLVLLNPKSGGRQGERVLRKFQYLLNPRQIYNLEQSGPIPGLNFFRLVPNFRILICGGDGTVGWVLDCIGYEGGNLIRLLKDIEQSSEVMLDRWHLEITPKDKDSKGDPVPHCVFNNYFSIGVDASIAHRFHLMREKYPEKFTSRMKNRLWYFEFGTTETFASTCKKLQTFIEVECDGTILDLKSTLLEGIAILNIPSMYGGTNLWGETKRQRSPSAGKKSSEKSQRETTTDPKELKFCIQDFSDRLLEVVGLGGAMEMGQIYTGLKSAGRRLAQCASITIRTTKMLPMQVDGEPWLQAPCTAKITHKNQMPMLLGPPPKPSFFFLKKQNPRDL